MNAPDQSITDEQRERRIHHLGDAMVLETGLVERARMWREMRELIAHRSPAVVQRMEEQRGLR